MLALSLITTEATQRVASEPDPVLRNLLITQSYHELSRAIGGVIGEENANWSTFACWASKTAGISIRSEEVPRFFEKDLGMGEDTLSQIGGTMGRILSSFGGGRLVWSAALETLSELSVQIALGNQKVYAELAPLFARFVELMAGPDPEGQLVRLCDELTPGPTERGGQAGLKEAFVTWFEASRQEDRVRRAQLVLLSNCLIGLHEQTRLQPHIQRGLDAPIAVLVNRRLRARIGGLLGRPIAAVIGFFAGPLVEHVADQWRRLATRHAMNLSLPGGSEIPLGRDLPQLPQTFPADLDPVVEPRTLEVLRTFDRDLASTTDSGAENWVNLADRMGFIVELFRSKQRDAELLGPPFTAAQTRAILAGQIPEGVL